MNRAEAALSELREMDSLAAQDSPVHRLCPTAKLVCTFTYIAVLLSFGKYELSGMSPLLLYPVLLFQMSGISVRACFRKLRFALPLVLAVGAANPFLDRTILLRLGGIPVTGGWLSFFSLALKGVLSLTVSFLLVATTGLDRLCAALRRLHVPGLLVTLLLLTSRYLGVMTEEIAVMTAAYQLRAPGQRGIRIDAWGSFLGQLLLRSMDRAQELYASMRLRGFSGEYRYVAVQDCTWRDGAYVLVCAALFFLCRAVDLARLLGNVWVGVS